jgi:hypothetical protein
MWVDPDDDPRNSGGVSPDGELATLQDYLSDYWLTLQMECEGLHAEQLARRSMPPTVSPLGLFRHLAEVERNWRNWITSGDPLPKLYGEGDTARQTVQNGIPPGRDWRHTGRVSESGRALRERRYRRQELLVHRIEEYARHCGHTDLLRECIEGHVGQWRSDRTRDWGAWHRVLDALACLGLVEPMAVASPLT